MLLPNRNFIILFNSKEYSPNYSSTPSLAARKFFSSINKSNQIKSKIEFYVKETTEGSKKKIYGPYIGNKKKSKKIIKGGYNNIQSTNIDFAKVEKNCIFFKPVKPAKPVLLNDKINENKSNYQYIVCKTILKNYEFKIIIGNKTNNIDIKTIDKNTLIELKEYIETNNIFRTLKRIIDNVIKIKNNSLKQFENKQLDNLDKLLIKEAFIQPLSEHNSNEVITLSDLKIKKLFINHITYIFFNPVPLTSENNIYSRYKHTLNNYYYRYIFYIKDNQTIFKEIFLNTETSEIDIRQINIRQINQENLAKLNNSSKKLINELNMNIQQKFINNSGSIYALV